MLYFYLIIALLFVTTISVLTGLWYIIFMVLFILLFMIFLGIVNYYYRLLSRSLEILLNFVISFVFILFFFVLLVNPIFIRLVRRPLDIELSFVAMSLGLVLYSSFILIFERFSRYREYQLLELSSQNIKNLLISFVGLLMIFILGSLIYIPFMFNESGFLLLYLGFLIFIFVVTFILIFIFYFSGKFKDSKLDFFAYSMHYMKVLAWLSLLLVLIMFIFSLLKGFLPNLGERDLTRHNRMLVLEKLLELYYKDNGNYPQGKCTSELKQYFVPTYLEELDWQTVDPDSERVVYGTMMGGCTAGDFGYSTLKYEGKEDNGYVLLANFEEGGNFLVGGKGIVNFTPDCSGLGTGECEYEVPFNPASLDSINPNVFDDIEDFEFMDFLYNQDNVDKDKLVFVVEGKKGE